MNKRGNNSIWKVSFFTLLTINAAILLTVGLLLFWPVPKSDKERLDNPITMEDSSEFTVRTTKENINDLTNAYLSKYLKGTDHSYTINIDDDVELIGELPFFSTTLPLRIHFDPIVQENGDLVLKQNSISVGKLELPNKQIMRYLGQYLPMPDWVTVNADDEEIYVSITEMKIKSNFKVYAEQFDLKDNIVALKIDVPYKTLGIDPVLNTE